METKNIFPIDAGKIYFVYSGKKEGCRCGCLGKYYYASAYRELASADRGYEITEDEVSDKMVKRVCKLINQNEQIAEITNNEIVNIEMQSGRVYTACLLPADHEKDEGYTLINWLNIVNS